VEGDSVTDPEFLDDPAGIIPGIPGSIRLDNREQLFQESGESFSWWRPKKLLRLDPTPFISDLVVHRWHRRPFSPDEEIVAVRQLQADRLAYDKLPRGTQRKVLQVACDKLLARFHGKVLQVANGHMPRYWRHRGQALRDKHTNNLLYEDLVAAGVAAMWRAAFKFDLEAGYRFWTGVRAPVLGAISDEARIWRRHGSGARRIDRWLYTHPDASPEQVLAAQDRLHKVEERLARWLLEHPLASPEEILKERQRIHKLLPFHSLKEAAEGIKQFWAWGSEFDYSTETDETFKIGGHFAVIYSCFDRFSLSPQLKIHERFSLLVDRVSGGLDTGPDVGNATYKKEPHEPLDCTETAVLQFKNGKRQVTRQKAASYCYGIVVTPELSARALEDLKFAEDRWQSRIRRGPLPAEQYPRWSTRWLNRGRVGQGTLGRAEDENKHLVPAYVPITRFKWEVEYRGAEGNVLQVLESPSRHCLKTRPCEICNRSRANNVPRLSVSLYAA
jgi:hypothetical protein